MKMLARLRYLLEEGFEVGKISACDGSHGGLGTASITFVILDADGTRRLTTEEFEVTAEEASQCSRLFLESGH